MAYILFIFINFRIYYVMHKSNVLLARNIFFSHFAHIYIYILYLYIHCINKTFIIFQEAIVYLHVFRFPRSCYLFIFSDLFRFPRSHFFPWHISISTNPFFIYFFWPISISTKSLFTFAFRPTNIWIDAHINYKK